MWPLLLCAYCHVPSTCFFFTDTAPAEIYTLSLHDALPICQLLARLDASDYRLGADAARAQVAAATTQRDLAAADVRRYSQRSEEHTSELQSHSDLVCRLLLEKKKD